MMGLLIKDIKLMKAQKNFFLLIAAITAGMAVFTEDPSFVIGYSAFLGFLFSLNTISYDELDNGNAFLFSLPITRKGYALEKYGFGLITGGGSWLMGTMIVMFAGIAKNNISGIDTIMDALAILPVMLIILAVTLPFQLKFGGDKGRIAIIGAVGLMFIIGFIIFKIAGEFNVDLASVFNNLPTLSMGRFLAAVTGFGVLAMLLSYKISASIMNKKEF